MKFNFQESRKSSLRCVKLPLFSILENLNISHFGLVMCCIERSTAVELPVHYGLGWVSISQLTNSAGGTELLCPLDLCLALAEGIASTHPVRSTVIRSPATVCGLNAGISGKHTLMSLSSSVLLFRPERCSRPLFLPRRTATTRIKRQLRSGDNSDQIEKATTHIKR